jgi:hypothetical protein
MNDVPIIKAYEDAFVGIPTSARLAILLPTGRWTPLAQSIIGSLVGVANDEIVVLIADNCENAEKRDFLRKIRSINPKIIAISHEKNIGSAKNFFYLFDWCKDVEFCAVMADDDWMSPTYHVDAYRALLDKPSASGAAVGTTFVDIGDGKHVDVSQPSMCGVTPIERIRQWNGIVARATMYNVSRRKSLEAAVQYLRTAPLSGITLAEDLWELNRLLFGDFLNIPGHGCFVHYPAAGSRVGDGTQRFYELFCKDFGLQFHFVYFLALSTAIQTAMFLMGNLSPIEDPEQRVICGQYVFKHIFTTSFLPKVSGEGGHAAAASLFANHPEAMAGFSKYCDQSFAEQLYFDQAVLDWFIEIIKVFETKPIGDEIALSERFRLFVESICPKNCKNYTL